MSNEPHSEYPGIKIVPYKPEESIKLGLSSYVVYLKDQPLLQADFYGSHYFIIGYRRASLSNLPEIWKGILGSLQKTFPHLVSFNFDTAKNHYGMREISSESDLEKLVSECENVSNIQLISLQGIIVSIDAKLSRVIVTISELLKPEQYAFIKHLTSAQISPEQVVYIGQFLAEKSLEHAKPN